MDFTHEYLLEKFLSEMGAPLQRFPSRRAKEGVIGLDLKKRSPDLATQVEDIAERAAKNRTRAIVIGPQSLQSREANAAVQSLIKHRESLHSLEGIFLGALEFRHFHQNRVVDIRHLLESFPGLRVLGIHVEHGGWEEYPFTFNQVRHIGLQTLLYQSHLDARKFAAELGECVFPSLERMVLNTDGDYEYGDAFLQSIFANDYSALRHLTFPASCDADDFAIRLAASPLLKQLETVDLSNGFLSDDGVIALLSNPHICSLKELTIGRHFASERVMGKLASVPLKLHHTPAEPDDAHWELQRERQIIRLIRKHVKGEFIIRVVCLPHLDPSVLSEVVYEGSLRFLEDTLEEEYLGEVLDHPTWLDIILEANRQQLAIGDNLHTYLKGWWLEEADPELPGVRRAGLDLSS